MWTRFYDDEAGMYAHYDAHVEATDVWEEHNTEDGDMYLFSRATNETAWELPPAETMGLEVADHEAYSHEAYHEAYHEETAQLESEWDEFYDEASGYPYYVHRVTGESSWEQPAGWTEAGAEQAQEWADPYAATAEVQDTHAEDGQQQQLQWGEDHGEWDQNEEQWVPEEGGEMHNLDTVISAEATETAPPLTHEERPAGGEEDAEVEDVKVGESKTNLEENTEVEEDAKAEEIKTNANFNVEENTEVEEDVKVEETETNVEEKIEKEDVEVEEKPAGVKGGGVKVEKTETNVEEKTEKEDVEIEKTGQDKEEGRAVEQPRHQEQGGTEVRELPATAAIEVVDGAKPQAEAPSPHVSSSPEPKATEPTSRPQQQDLAASEPASEPELRQASREESESAPSRACAPAPAWSRPKKSTMKAEVEEKKERRRTKTNPASLAGRNAGTLLITVQLPEALRGQVANAESLQEMPYAHLARQQEFDRQVLARAAQRRRKDLAHVAKTESRRRLEEERLAGFAKETVRLEQEDARARRKHEAKLSRDKETLLRQKTAKRLLELLPAAPSEQVEPKSKTKAKLKRWGSGRRASGSASGSGSGSSPDSAHTQPAQPVLPPIEALMWDDAEIRRLEKNLETKAAAQLKTWRSAEAARLDEEVQSKVSKRLAKFAKAASARIASETQRREAFDSESAAVQQAHEAAVAAFAAEADRLEVVERKLRRLEAHAHEKQARRRRAYLDVMSKCLDRGMLRRLSWTGTLEDCDSMGRTVFLVRDELTKQQLELTTMTLGTSAADSTGVERLLFAFQEAGSPGLLSAAQRKDDRLALSSRNLAQLHRVMGQQLDVRFNLMVLTTYYACAGNPRGVRRLKDVIDELAAKAVGPRTMVPETVLVRWAAELNGAVRALHSRGLVHLCVDPDVVFLAHDHLPCDEAGHLASSLRLGLPPDVRAMGFGGTGKGTGTGEGAGSDTPPVAASDYSAPELRYGDCAKPSAADVWSLGAVMYHVATGCRLPESFRMGTLVAAPGVQRYGRWLRDLLRMTLQVHPGDRASCTDIADFFYDVSDAVALKHCEEEAFKERRHSESLQVAHKSC